MFYNLLDTRFAKYSVPSAMHLLQSKIVIRRKGPIIETNITDEFPDILFFY